MYNVEGFEFDREELAQEARKEAEGIRYIKSQTNMKDAVTVLKLHNRLLQKEVFTTPVGFAFLSELREYLNGVPFIDSGDIEPMPDEMQQALLVLRRTEPKKAGRNRREKRKSSRTEGKRERKKPEKKKKERNYRTAFFVSTFFAAVFALSLVGVFVIAASERSVNIVNYENALIDRYESWEQELDERERRLDERERQLNEREAGPGQTGEGTAD